MKVRLWLPLLLGFAVGACAASDSGEEDGGGTAGTAGVNGSGTAGTTGNAGTTGIGAAGTTGTAGTSGGAGATGGAGRGGSTGAAGTGAAGTAGGAGRGGSTGAAGTGAAGTAGGAGRGGSTGAAGTGAAGTAGGAGRGGSTGAAGTGAAGTVGGAGRGGTAGTGGAGGGSSCGVLPVNPNATPQARNLLCYLYSQYGNHVLSGQQETSWVSNPDVDTNYIFTNTGKYPVVRGGDYLYPSGTTTRAQAWWNAGGIPMLCYHMGAPPNADSYDNSMLSATGGIDAVLTPGTASYTSFIQKLDYAAGELQKLQAANVAVLWRPLHESGGTWFWWSKETGAQYVRLWNFMYDYFTNTKKLNNLIWLHPYDGTPLAAFYPGKAVVDVGGADTYATNTPFTSMFNSTRTIVGTAIPIALHENGQMPDPAAMFATSTKAPWVLFNTWATYEMPATAPGNTVAYVQSVYASTYVVTRDEVPSLK